MSLKTKVWRVIDIINSSKEFFEKNGIDSPRLTIELILSHILGINRVNLYTNFDKPLNEFEIKKVREMVKLRGSRLPLQYILGETEFFGEKFIVNNNVLIPRPETEELVELIINEADKTKHLKILDIGTGSGCIAIILAKYLPKAEITALDCSHSALNIAKQNAKNLSIENINFVKADILKVEPQFNYDIIVSNPPYISEIEMKQIEPELNFEPRIALTDSSDGLIFYRRFVTIFKVALSYEGRFYLELNNLLVENIKDIFNKDYNISVINDISNNQRILRGEKKSG